MKNVQRLHRLDSQQCRLIRVLYSMTQLLRIHQDNYPTLMT